MQLPITNQTTNCAETPQSYASVGAQKILHSLATRGYDLFVG